MNLKNYNIFFYHKDHLGSSTQISDMGQHVVHHIEYLPTGFLFAEQSYYTPEIGIWLSVDPLSDKYPSMSAFMYCAGNPVVLVDPDGRDIYQVDESGKIQGRIKNKSYDQFQVVSVDGNGDKTVLSSSEKYKKGTVGKSLQNIRATASDGKSIKLDAYSIKGSENGESIHKFLSDNTNVEFGRWDFSSGVNVIGTSHEKGRDGSARFMKEYLSNNNWFGFLETFDHNHPGGTMLLQEHGTPKTKIKVIQIL